MPWLYNCAFPVETMEEQNGLGFVSPIGWFEPTHNAIKTICRESKCKSRAELAKLAWAILPRCSFAYSKKKRWVLCVSNQLLSVILVSFFSLCLKRDYRKKGKIGLMYRTSSWSELLSTLNDSFTITKVLCISTENVKGWWYVVEIEKGCIIAFRICSPNAALGVWFYWFCYIWRVMHYIFIMYMRMLLIRCEFGCKALSFLTKC